MANKNINALTSASSPLAGTEELPIFQSGTTVKATVANLTAGRQISVQGLTVAYDSGSVTSGITLQELYAPSAHTWLITQSYLANGVTFRDVTNSTNPFNITPTGINSTKIGVSNADEVYATILNATGLVTFSNYGAGAATFSAAGVISSVSDETWKTKDGVPDNPDVMIKKLQPGYWFYNAEKAPIYGFDRQLGFFAQNVNAAIGPEAAPEPEAGKPWGYYDRSVLAITVMSLQKALDTIESLNTRIIALESKA